MRKLIIDDFTIEIDDNVSFIADMVDKTVTVFPKTKKVPVCETDVNPIISAFNNDEYYEALTESERLYLLTGALLGSSDFTVGNFLELFAAYDIPIKQIVKIFFGILDHYDSKGSL